MRSLAVCIALVATLIASAHAQNRTCGPSEKPKELPAVSALLDSARILHGLGPADVAPNGVVFSLLYLESDSFPQIRVLEASIDSASLLLAGALRPQRTKQPWAVRARIGGTEQLTVTIERATYCPPVLIDKSPYLTETFMVNARPGDTYNPSVNRHVRVQVIIAESGGVADVRMLESTGLREFDEQIIQYYRMHQWLPALVDGFPITSWYRNDGQSLRM